jgi:hypothetical protein
MQLLISLFMALPSFASTPALDNSTCQDRVERGGSIQVQMRPTGNGDCFVSVSDFKKDSMIYRGYVFAADGNLMVFNSFGTGPVSETTGAREFYTFPRRFKYPSFTWDQEQRALKVISTTGDEYYFDFDSAQLKGQSKAEVYVASEVTKGNAGGVEIKNYKGLILDAGFKMGSAPTSNPRGKVKFTDEVGKTCELTVGDIFSYREDGDPYVKFSDKNLASFLKKKCSKLKFPTL